MNYRMIFKSIGTVLCLESACMLPSLLVAFIYNEGDALSFIISILIVAVIGFGLIHIKTTTSNIYARDGFAIVALSWILVSAFGALPYVISGSIPSLMDALFESISGFSTTGSSILKNIEALSKGILFWRSFTHWMGGMGVLVLMLAILSSVNASTLHIMRAEATGPSPGKVVPKIGQTAKILYAIYTTLTAIQIVFLLIGGMSLYDAMIHAFSTAGTGGFSNMNTSVAAYGSVYIETVITVFMLLFGINFTLYYMSFKGGIKAVLRDEELRFYFGVVAISIILITININGTVYNSIGEAIRYASFQVSSIITTTGFITADFNLWPVFSQIILLLLMFIGASTGSTGGGIKCLRIILLFKIIKREITRINHPRVVQSVKINGHVVDEEILSGVMAFFFFLILIFSISVLVVSLEGRDIITSVTSVITAINNVGPGLGELVGPTGNFAELSTLSKAVLSFCMIVGRLEVYPIMLLFFPSFWKRISI